MLSPGDLVRFINENVEGVVVSIQKGDRVELRDTDGFKRTAHKNELVLVKFCRENEEHIFQEGSSNQEKLQVSNPTVIQHKQPATRFVHLLNEEEAIQVIFSLVNPINPLTSEVECWFVNSTNYHVAFVLSQEAGDLRTNGMVGNLLPQSENNFKSFKQDQLFKSNSFEVQLLIYDLTDFKPRPPLTKRFFINLTELLDVASIKSNDLLQRVVKKPIAVLREQEIDIEKLVSKFQDSDDDFSKSKQINAKRNKNTVRFKEKVVDLHIEELVKDPSSMSPAQIIAMQLDIFDKEMDRAFVDHLSKIVFIHGVGAGILRSAIREAFKRYDNIRYSDASFEKYGYGATQVDFL